MTLTFSQEDIEAVLVEMAKRQLGTHLELGQDNVIFEVTDESGEEVVIQDIRASIDW